MCLHPAGIEPVPEATARIARAAFPKGNPYMTMRDELGTFFTDSDFADLYPKRGQPAFAPWRLALVTIFQFAEGLSDRQAADAVRARIDWKYALGLELTDPGFDFSVLCEFRERLLAGGAEERLLDRMLEHFRDKQLLKARGKQRTDSTHVLAAIRTMNRLERMAETLRAALNEVASVAPDWLRSMAPPEWYERYHRRVEDYRLPQAAKARTEYGEQIGRDGLFLLKAIEDQRPDLASLAGVIILKQMWDLHFSVSEKGEVHLRDPKELPKAASVIESPYDTDARHSTKHSLHWTGYKVHYSETFDEDLPHLITNVHTTVATTQDVSSTAAIQMALFAKDLPPLLHLVDAGYVDAELLLQSRELYGIELFGPTRKDSSWQHREHGNDQSAFTVDWENKKATCPNGKQSVGWTSYVTKPHGYPVAQMRFDKKDCDPCPQRDKCVRSNVGQPRILTLHTQAQTEILQQTRKRVATEEGLAEYAQRNGIEGALSQGVRRCDLRHSRYRGLAKTHLQNVVIAASLNVARAVNHLDGIPVATTRVSRFARLLA